MSSLGRLCMLSKVSIHRPRSSTNSGQAEHKDWQRENKLRLILEALTKQFYVCICVCYYTGTIRCQYFFFSKGSSCRCEMSAPNLSVFAFNTSTRYKFTEQSTFRTECHNVRDTLIWHIVHRSRHYHPPVSTLTTETWNSFNIHKESSFLYCITCVRDGTDMLVKILMTAKARWYITFFFS